MPLISYASNQEDVLLWHAVGKLTVGRFITVSPINSGTLSSLDNFPARDNHDNFGHLVTRSFLECGWAGVHLYFSPESHAITVGTQLTLDGNPPASRAALAEQIKLVLQKVARVPLALDTQSLLVFILSDLNALGLAFEELDWEIFKPAIVLINIGDDISLKASTTSSWQHTLLLRGYQLAHQVGQSYFFVSEEQAEIPTLLNHLQLDRSYMTQEMLDLRIAQTELSLKLNNAENALMEAQAHSDELRTELTRVEQILSDIPQHHFLIPRRPHALIKKLQHKLMEKICKYFPKKNRVPNQHPKS